MIGAFRSRLPGREDMPFWRSLSVRLAMLLSVALLPLGMIAVSQTWRLERELGEVNSLTLISFTAQVASQERERIEAAFGAANGLAASLPELGNDPERCERVFSTFLEEARGRFSFAGFVPRSGIVSCSSVGEVADISDFGTFKEIVDIRERAVTLDQVGRLSGEAVLVVSLPVHGEDGAYEGFVAISIPHNDLDSPYAEIIGGRAMDLFTINRTGEVLTASGSIGTAADRLPADRAAEALVGGADRFSARNGLGQERIYSVVPIVEGTVYAVGAWQPEHGVPSDTAMRFLWSPALFPILMWAASLVLVIMAVEWLLVRHVRVIADQMRRFGRDRALPAALPEGRLPNELQAIEEEFVLMAARLIRDEAELLDTMHDKDVLLKEVHHRVKNNLQLISSIVNMQARRTTSKPTRAALESVNRRVSSMATVHRRLYQAENLGQVRADELLRDVVAPLTDLAQPGKSRPRVELRLDPVVLYPDQAVPAALLVVEAVTNALKYLGPDSTGDTWLRVGLEDRSEDQVQLYVQSSQSPEAPDGDEEPEIAGTGLGNQLITAFSRQLGGEPEVEDAQDVYSLRVTFTAASFDPDGDAA
ncbi:hypothetical protein SAMN05421757_108114 [Tropicimonas sediminicola]|uniref:histidine kinase n=2 Tax=Tropicimonas sediminicola TaxID=1031541 RepID=A0A239KZU1_9RHOB|nr:hypothetical protein SAMN05421757_108114 [Tropicimonas sediminicola]